MGSTVTPEFALSAPLDGPAVVLDTNVVLDWLLFKDARVAALTQALQGGALQWLSCARMRDELARTLSYPILSKWSPDSERVLTSFDAWARMRVTPPASHPRLRCDDPDDQVFLDLAFAHGAGLLVSRDRALLRLRKQASALGLTIIAPAEFARHRSASRTSSSR